MIRKAKLNTGYKITDEGDKQHVAFWGDGVAWGGYVAFPIFYAVLIGFLFSPWWYLAAAVGLGLGYILFLMFQPQNFTLTPTGLIKKGTEYSWENIGEVVLDNPADKGVSYTGNPGVIVGGTGIMGASVAGASVAANLATGAMVEMNAAILKAAAKRRFRVRIRHGATLITVARNLKQPKAAAIFDLLTGK
ncbi:MAG TPA: hypothetical protein PKY73_00325 [Hyphomonas sp.]|nr:hypothetical protein [Hyphomonas sp.]